MSKKVNLNKTECLAEPDKYQWIVGKGCFLREDDDDGGESEIYQTCSDFFYRLSQDSQTLLTEYQLTLFTKANQLLWKLRGESWKDVSGLSKDELRTAKKVAKIVDIISKHGLVAKENFSVYRNFYYTQEKKEKNVLDYITEMKAGKTVDFYGLMSTAVDPTLFEERKNVAHIIVPKGARYICPNKLLYDETEIVLLPGKLVKISSEKGGLGTWRYTAF